MPLILGANSLTGGYDVDNSLRFNSGSSDYLEKALTGVDGNRQIWTFSSWVKRAKLSTVQTIFSFGENLSSEGKLEFDADDFLVLVNDFQNGGSNETDMKFRDTSAWYHIVWACDSTQATNADRWKLYVNGTQVTLTGSPAITLNGNGIINAWGAHDCWLGANARSQQSGNPTNYSDVYLSETHFIDGQQLTPTDFGEFDEDSGIWKPIAYTGTYGTNGFFLEFLDSSALGDDTSGNSNDFTVNNLTSIDQTTDTPTNNFATFNAVAYENANGTTEGMTRIDGGSAAANNMAIGSIAFTQGKWYAEFNCDSVGGNYPSVGIISYNDNFAFANRVGQLSKSYGYLASGDINNNNTLVTATGTTYTSTDIIGVAVDCDANLIYWYKNGTIVNVGGTAIASGEVYTFAVSQYSNTGHWFANFGNPAYTISSGNADANGYGNFEYSVLSGYYALNTKNLADYG
jgi:hypothetical protein